MNRLASHTPTYTTAYSYEDGQTAHEALLAIRPRLRKGAMVKRVLTEPGENIIAVVSIKKPGRKIRRLPWGTGCPATLDEGHATTLRADWLAGRVSF